MPINRSLRCLVLWLGFWLGLWVMPQVWAQEVIYRCGHEYTNQKPVTPIGKKAPDCQVLQGVSVTEIKGPDLAKQAPMDKKNPDKNGLAKNSAGAKRANEAIGSESKENPEQAVRQEAKAILEAEWTRAQSQRQALLAAYENGAPPLLGDEVRNHQKYLDRVAELKRQLDRNEADLTGLQHELNRLK